MSAPAAIAYAEEVLRRGESSGVLPTAQISYGDTLEQQLDIYVPTKASAGCPIVIFFHGGAWINGGLEWLRFMAPTMTAMGAIFVAATYRLAPQSRWPAQYEDASAAVLTGLQEAQRYGGSPQRLVLGGHSAGGHLAMLVALRNHPTAPCLPISAPLDLRYGDVPSESLQGRVYKYLFTERSQDAEASPICYVSQARAPIHLTWGENDFPHVADSNARIYTALQQAGVPVTSHTIAGASHFDTHLDLSRPDTPWYQALRRLTPAG